MPDKEKEFDELDSYVVSDMSGVERPSLGEIFFGHGFKVLREHSKRENRIENIPKEPVDLTHEETKWYILGSLKAGLLVALAYAAGLGLVILIMLLVFSIN
jgi:hypothetical protein